LHVIVDVFTHSDRKSKRHGGDQQHGWRSDDGAVDGHRNRVSVGANQPDKPNGHQWKRSQLLLGTNAGQWFFWNG
jgi:hypothetical protein